MLKQNKRENCEDTLCHQTIKVQNLRSNFHFCPIFTEWTERPSSKFLKILRKKNPSFWDFASFKSSLEKKLLAWHCLQVSLFASVQFVYLQVPYTIQKGETCKFDAKCSQFLVAPFREICLMMYPKFKYLHRIALFGFFKNKYILIQRNHKLTIFCLKNNKELCKS